MTRASTASRPDSSWERRFLEAGRCAIAGVDEVGRGCLFGPVVAAAVVLDPARPIRGLNDSKQLDAATREQLDARIRDRAVSFAIAAVDAATIDRVNIYQAARLAMEAAVNALRPAADALLVDAMKLSTTLPQYSIIHGDAVCRSIAAASIVAKVERDRWMRSWDEIYPEYRLAANKGYGTPDHLAVLRRLGPTPLHRHSFAPVAAQGWFSHIRSTTPIERATLVFPGS